MTEKYTRNCPKVRENLMFKEMDDGAIIYEPEKEICYSLNVTAAYIWSLCDGKNSIENMIASVKSYFTSFTVEPESAIQEVIDDFRKNDLLENL